MIDKNSISIFGRGALGSALHDFFKSKSYSIRSVWSREGGEIFSKKDFLVKKSDKKFPDQDSDIGNTVFIVVPDDQIASLSKQLSETPIRWENRSIIHCSGNLPSSACAKLQEKGSRIAAMHPIQTFQKGDLLHRFNNIYITLEGEPELVNDLCTIVNNMGAHPIRISPEQKRTIHLAAVIVSNYMISLMHISETLLHEAGIEKGIDILGPLVSQTVENVFKIGVAESLTGPISRGDVKSVKHHLDSLTKNSHHSEIYKLLGLEAISIAQKKGNVSRGLLSKLEQLLKD